VPKVRNINDRLELIQRQYRKAQGAILADNKKVDAWKKFLAEKRKIKYRARGLVETADDVLLPPQDNRAFPPAKVLQELEDDLGGEPLGQPVLYTRLRNIRGNSTLIVLITAAHVPMTPSLDDKATEGPILKERTDAPNPLRDPYIFNEYVWNGYQGGVSEGFHDKKMRTIYVDQRTGYHTENKKDEKADKDRSSFMPEFPPEPSMTPWEYLKDEANPHPFPTKVPPPKLEEELEDEPTPTPKKSEELPPQAHLLPTSA
jgi:hypothetical protein